MHGISYVEMQTVYTYTVDPSITMFLVYSASIEND